MMTSVRRASLRLALIAVASVAAAIVGNDTVTSATSPALHAMTFMDDSSGFVISVQLDAAAPDAGHWVLRTDRGVYTGDAGASLKVNSATSAVITYAGPATYRTGTSALVTRSIRLNAQLDPAHHTAEAKLWDASDQFHIVAKAVTAADLKPVLAATEAAITTNDTAALYALADRQVRRLYDAATFGALLTSEAATYGRITALRESSIGAPQVTDQGFWYLSVDYAADIVGPTGASSASFTAFFIHEPNGWKLWTTVRR